MEGQYFGNRIEQCGGSWMFIPDTGSRFLPIPSRLLDPKTGTKVLKKKICCNFLRIQ
jgi:hypothetical protein